MRKKEETIKDKYGRYIANLNWHIETNKPVGVALALINQQIGIYQQIIIDLEKIIYF